MQVSIIIPVLNGEKTLPACLAAVAQGGPVEEIIVVDGGSTDRSVAIARSGGARVAHAAPGRGGQLRLGVAAAKNPWLLLLHADTILSPGWAAADHFSRPGQAGYFRFRLDSPRHAARRLEQLVVWRCKYLALPYGDQGLLISADLLRSAGGVPDLPIMEDVALVHRLGRRRLRALSATATTSAARCATCSA